MTIEQQPHGRKPKKKATAPNVVAGTLHDPAPFFTPGEPAIRFTGGADAAAAAEAEVRAIATSDITTSSFNIPHRDPDEELIASVKARGVIEPPLVRPIPRGAVITDAGGTQRTVHFELVFGERRWKANGIAGHPTLLCVVRELTDEQALDLQTEENLQRKDLTPLQEAAVFEVYQRRGTEIPAIAARVHKSERHVVQRLKLLELTDAEKAALLLGKILLGVALELACLPKSLSREDRDAALLLVMPSDGSVLSVKEGRSRLTRRYYLRCVNAPFALDDATLVPTAGACMTCPKRTGTQMALSIEGLDNDDRCSDAACWSSKEVAAWKRTQDEAKAKGIRVLDALSAKKGEADEARKVLNGLHSHRLVSLDAACHDLADPEFDAAEKALDEAQDALGEAQKAGDDEGVTQAEEAATQAEEKLQALEKRKVPTWRELLGEAATPTAIVRDRTYDGGKDGTRSIELVDRRTALAVLKEKGVALDAEALFEESRGGGAAAGGGGAERDGAEGDGARGRGTRDQELRAGQRLQDRVKELYRARLREVLVEHAEETPPRPGMGFWRALIAGALAFVQFDPFAMGWLFKARGWPGFEELDDDDVLAAVMARADHMTEPQLRGLLVDVLCADDDARKLMPERVGIATAPLEAAAMKAAKAELGGGEKGNAKKKVAAAAGSGDEVFCRECGCRDDHACIDPKDGLPCSWTEPDLCSACAGTRVAKGKKKGPKAKPGQGEHAGASS